MSDLCLTGYRHSVYTRAARIALAELGLAYTFDEVNPFLDQVPGHPFDRVPVLEDGAVRIYEAWAILTYLHAGVPSDQSRLEKARAAQVASIVNAYAYWPLVRQVYANAVFAPAMGLEADADVAAAGLVVAGPVLDALEDIAAEGQVLNGRAFGPADWLLFPMTDAFARDARGAAALRERSALAGWHDAMAALDHVAASFAPLDTGI